MSVDAPTPTLPSDLVVTALYGAGEETYRLADPEPGEVLFCRAERLGDPTPGAAGAPGQAGREILSCELWTDSSVTFRAKSHLYPLLEAELRPTVDVCGVVTTRVELSLERAEETGDNGG